MLCSYSFLARRYSDGQATSEGSKERDVDQAVGIEEGTGWAAKKGRWRVTFAVGPPSYQKSTRTRFEARR